MLTEDELRHFDRFLDAIQTAISRFPERFRHCLLEALTEGTEPLFCLIRAGVDGRVMDEFLDYGKVQMRREVFRSDDLRARLEALNSTGMLTTKHGAIAVRYNAPYQEFHASRSEYHHWPGCLFKMGSSQHNIVPSEPLVGRGLPPFFDAKDAVRHWIKVPVGDSDARFRQVLLFIPDFAARLDRMSFTDGALRVLSSFHPGGALEISVLATDGHETFRKSNRLRKSQTFRMMSNPTSLRVFITNEGGRIVDSFSEEPAWATRERVIFAGARYSEASMDLIRRGESDTVEFKVFIRLEDQKKADELVKAVISFANAAGGTIFIGVTDDAEIEGVEAQVPHDKKKAETFDSDYFAAIRKLLRQKLNRIPVIETHSEKIGDKTVFLIRVEEGIAKPYFNVQTKGMFIRRGASDVRPDPDKDLRQMVESGRGPELLPFGLSQ
jgi:hypothetical protein